MRFLKLNLAFCFFATSCGSGASYLPLYMSNQSLLSSQLCKLHTCSVEQEGGFTINKTNKKTSYQIIKVLYRYGSDIASATSEFNQARITTLRDDKNRLIRIHVEFHEYFDSRQIINFSDSKFSTELVRFALGKEYKVRPNRNDDMNRECYSQLNRNHQYKVLSKSSSQSTDIKAKSGYVLYCAIYPGSIYPEMFPRNEQFYQAKPVLVISDSMDFTPAKLFDP